MALDELDTTALTALQALVALLEAYAVPQDRVCVGFAFLDGRAFVLDTGVRPMLRPQASESAAAPVVLCNVLCNGAGLVGLLRDTLGTASDQVFLCRGEPAALLALAAILERQNHKPWELRVG